MKTGPALQAAEKLWFWVARRFQRCDKGLEMNTGVSR